jgi:hypothetical protein
MQPISKPIWSEGRFFISIGAEPIDNMVPIMHPGCLMYSYDGNNWIDSSDYSIDMQANTIACRDSECVGVGRTEVLDPVHHFIPAMIHYYGKDKSNPCTGFQGNHLQALLSDSSGIFAFGMANSFYFSFSPTFSFRSFYTATSSFWVVPRNACVKGRDLFVKIGSVYANTYIETSKNGFSWSSQDIGSTLFRSIAWGGDYIMVGDSGSIRLSSDATTWDTVPSPTTSTLNRITYAAGQYVAIGDSGVIITSPDGATWTKQKSGTTESLNGIVWAENRFLAVGTKGTILSSDDAENWSFKKSGSTKRLNSIAWGSGIYLAVGDSGTILSSSDTMDWSLSNAGTTANLNDVVFHNGRFVAAGSNATLLVSNTISSTIQRESRLNRAFAISIKGNICRYYLPFVSKRTALSQFDIRGRLIQSIILGKQLPGEHQISFPLECAPGSYILSLSADSFKIQRSVIISK